MKHGYAQLGVLSGRFVDAFDNPAWPTLIFSFGPPCVSHLYSVCHDLFSVLFPVRGCARGISPSPLR
jgi:hypothetical protein